MSSSISIQEKWYFELTKPLAASIAFVPVFYGFVVKSDQQLGQPISKMSVQQALLGGVKAMPWVGMAVGGQLIGQSLAEKAVINYLGKKDEQSKVISLLVSSLFVGVISVAPLAVLNGHTMNQGWKESLKKLSKKQFFAIVTRETSFLFSLSDTMNTLLKNAFGENLTVECGSTFISGALGSIIGHPADTALTLWQKERKVESFNQLMKGAPVKALAVGCFSVFYKLIQKGSQSFV